MQHEGGVYRIPCIVNGLKLKMVFDTGASTVCISESVAQMMYENDYLSDSDIVGMSSAMVADGRIVDQMTITLNTVEIGDKILHNVEASVVSGQAAPLLLGQSALKKLGPITIAGDKLYIGVETNNSTNPIDTIAALDEARKLYDKEFYELAAEKYAVAKKGNILSIDDHYDYAKCLSMIEDDVTAISVLSAIEDSYIDCYPDRKSNFYYRCGVCYYFLEDFDNAISYLQKTMLYTTPYDSIEVAAMEVYTKSYLLKGNQANATYVINDYINKYLKKKSYKPSDCWRLQKRDPLLGQLYYILFQVCEIEDAEINLMLAARWGYTEAIEACRKLGVLYTGLPYGM